MRPVYKFESMFRGQQVIIEYGLENSKAIDFAVISDDTPNFVHPDYELFDDSLDDFYEELWKITKAHIRKVEGACDYRF